MVIFFNNIITFSKIKLNILLFFYFSSIACGAQNDTLLTKKENYSLVILSDIEIFENFVLVKQDTPKFSNGKMVLFAIDNILLSDSFDSIPIQKNKIRKIKKDNSIKLPTNFINNRFCANISTKYILFINDTLPISKQKEKKNLKKKFKNYEIIELEIIEKKEMIIEYGWWRGRHGGLKITTRKIE